MGRWCYLEVINHRELPLPFGLEKQKGEGGVTRVYEYKHHH